MCNLRLSLISVLCLGFMLCAGAARGAANAEQVCAQKDFMELIAAFAELNIQQQTACVRFPLKIRGKTYTTQQAFLRSPAAETKLIISRKDAEKFGKAATSFFYRLPPDKNVSNATDGVEYVYIIEEQGHTRSAMLTEGGTLLFETVKWLWDGEQWKILDVTASQ